MADRKLERQLLGYLLGALDDSERNRIDRRLAGDPGLRQKLLQVEESLEPLRTVTRVHPPPSGLAARTCRMVFAYSEALTGRVREARAAPCPVRARVRAMSQAAVPPNSTASWGWSDLLVAVGVFLAISCSIFPAILRNRMNTRLVACQDHLRQIGATQAQFHHLHAGSTRNVVPGARGAAAGVPLAFVFSLDGAGDLAPAWAVQASGPPAKAPKSLACPVAERPCLGHQGFSQAVVGRNFLFLDGRVVFMAMGPVIDPTGARAGTDDPLSSCRPTPGDLPVFTPGDLPPVVLTSRPAP